LTCIKRGQGSLLTISSDPTPIERYPVPFRRPFAGTGGEIRVALIRIVVLADFVIERPEEQRR
jgi:hypothetical protein